MLRMRAIVAVLSLILALGPWSRPARGDDSLVPLSLQVELSAKIVEYLQAPSLEAMDVVRIAIVVRPGDAESSRAAAELRAQFQRLGPIAGHPHEQSLLAWPGAGPLAEEASRRGVAILYFTPGLAEEMASAAQALTGRKVLTIAAVDSYVSMGAILGFQLSSGHPKMVFNLAQARKQGVALRAAVMKLVRIVE